MCFQHIIKNYQCIQMPYKRKIFSLNWKNHLFTDCEHNPLYIFIKIWSINFVIFHIWSELFTVESSAVVTKVKVIIFNFEYKLKRKKKSQKFNWSLFPLWTRTSILGQLDCVDVAKNSVWMTHKTKKICALIFALILFIFTLHFDWLFLDTLYPITFEMWELPKPMPKKYRLKWISVNSIKNLSKLIANGSIWHSFKGSPFSTTEAPGNLTHFCGRVFICGRYINVWDTYTMCVNISYSRRHVFFHNFALHLIWNELN